LTLCLPASVVTAQNPALAANLKEYAVPAGAILRMELSEPVTPDSLRLP
jgi:hypothetical protein